MSQHCERTVRRPVRPPVTGPAHPSGMTDCTSTTSARLVREWARLRHRPALLRRAETWDIVQGPLTNLDQIVTAVGGDGDRSAEADRRFRRLVEIALTDDLAGRVAIERLRPGLLHAAVRDRRGPDGFEELLAAAWIAIRTYNTDRRNSNLVSSLLADAAWHAYRRQDRRLSNTDQPLGPAEIAAEPARPHPAIELAQVLADARAAGVAGEDLALIRLLIAHPSTEDVAAQLQVTSRTVRNRRARVTETLRQVVLAA
jgi:DNA-directed RNA polymerase specialized sigma24 family protein